jgi:hypothetical protein
MVLLMLNKLGIALIYIFILFVAAFPLAMGGLAIYVATMGHNVLAGCLIQVFALYSAGKIWGIHHELM